MAIQGIGTGLAPNDGNGDNLLTGALKINSNFSEIYTLLGNGGSLTSGIVTSIIAGTGITISGSTGSVTINSTASGGSGESIWRSTTVGVNTTSNVGIGSTGPTSKLDVVGNSKFTGVVTATTFVGNLTGDVFGGATQIYLNTSTTNSPTTGSWLIPFVDNPTGSNRLVYVTGVGWGPRWFNPTKSLYVTNDTTVNQTPSAQSGYTIISPNSITVGENVSIEGSSGITTTSRLSVGPNGAVITTTAAGLVGIGTTNPTSALTVKGTTSLETLYVTGGLGGTTTIQGGVISFNGNGSITQTGSQHIHRSSSSGGGSYYFSDYYVGTDHKIIYADGVKVELYSSDSKKFETIGTGVTVTGTTFTNQLSVSGVTTTATLNVGTGGTVITTTAAGLVGIGTTNPTSTLTVRGGDISVGINTSQGVILTSADGTKYRLFVENGGTLKTVVVP